MKSNQVCFEQSGVELADSSEYHKGELVGGCRVIDPIGDVDEDVRDVFYVNKAPRSVETSVSDLSEGNIVDLSFRKSSNSVNTPYRVVELLFDDEGDENELLGGEEYDFTLLLEPVIQNASLVVLRGFERFSSDNDMVVFEDVFSKRYWDSPTVEEFSELDAPSQFSDRGFKLKDDRRVTSISLVFDEVVAECVDLEDELVPLMI